MGTTLTELCQLLLKQLRSSKVYFLMRKFIVQQIYYSLLLLLLLLYYIFVKNLLLKYRLCDREPQCCIASMFATRDLQFSYIYIYIGHTQKNGAVLIVNTIKTTPLFCVCPVYIYICVCVCVCVTSKVPHLEHSSVWC
jgi:hypothetical protein